jgi:hypothetical protein
MTLPTYYERDITFTPPISHMATVRVYGIMLYNPYFYISEAEWKDEIRAMKPVEGVLLGTNEAGN